VEMVRAAAAAGQRAFGENYLREALAKMDALSGLALEWHFIGRLQSNKTRLIAERFAWVHSVDRLKTAEGLSHHRPDAAPPMNVCLQVNVSGEASKGGVDPGGLIGLAREVSALPRLRLRGIMAVPAPEADAALQRARFARVRATRSAPPAFTSTRCPWACPPTSRPPSPRARPWFASVPTSSGRVPCRIPPDLHRAGGAPRPAAALGLPAAARSRRRAAIRYNRPNALPGTDVPWIHFR